MSQLNFNRLKKKISKNKPEQTSFQRMFEPVFHDNYAVDSNCLRAVYRGFFMGFRKWTTHAYAEQSRTDSGMLAFSSIHHELSDNTLKMFITYSLPNSGVSVFLCVI